LRPQAQAEGGAVVSGELAGFIAFQLAVDWILARAICILLEDRKKK